MANRCYLVSSQACHVPCQLRPSDLSKLRGPTILSSGRSVTAQSWLILCGSRRLKKRSASERNTSRVIAKPFSAVSAFPESPRCPPLQFLRYAFPDRGLVLKRSAALARYITVKRAPELVSLPPALETPNTSLEPTPETAHRFLKANHGRGSPQR